MLSKHAAFHSVSGRRRPSAIWYPYTLWGRTHDGVHGTMAWKHVSWKPQSTITEDPKHDVVVPTLYGILSTTVSLSTMVSNALGVVSTVMSKHVTRSLITEDPTHCGVLGNRVSKHATYSPQSISLLSLPIYICSYLFLPFVFGECR